MGDANVKACKVLGDFNPDKIGYYFEQISAIPRRSHEEQQISDYLKHVGEQLGLETIQDAYNNVIIKKPATPGYEDRKPFIIQGHMDMVCERTPDSTHDFTTDPLELVTYKEGNVTFLKAKNTTLGADDGISMAYGLALLDSTNIPHPALEVVITTSEETDFAGAMGVDKSIFKAGYMLNIDSPEENKAAIGSAGGISLYVEVNLRKNVSIKAKNHYVITVEGLKGGHSGEDIHLGRANALQLLGEILTYLNGVEGVDVLTVNGGTAANAIPREAHVDIAVDPLKANINAIVQQLRALEYAWNRKYAGKENPIQVTSKPIELTGSALTWDPISVEAVADLLLHIPQGPLEMNPVFPQFVETSNNIGITKEIDNNTKCVLTCEIRCNNEDGKYKVYEDIETLCGKYSCVTIIERQTYPAWVLKETSEWRDLVKSIHDNDPAFTEEYEYQSIHAGLEAGFFVSAIEGLEAISIGPNTYDLHTPQERMDLDSFVRVWNLIKNILRETK